MCIRPLLPYAHVLISPCITAHVLLPNCSCPCTHFAVAHCLVCHSFIHSGYFYSISSSPLLLRGSPDTARILCRSFTLKHHRQLRVKDLPKVPTWQLERESNP